MRYKVRNLRKYQHYKNRRPPWVKVHRKMVEDQDHSGLSNSAWRLAIEILVLVSASDDESIDCDASSLSWTLRRKVTERDLQALVKTRFIVPASNVLADCQQSACSEYREQSSEVREQNSDTLVSSGQETSTRRGEYTPGFQSAWLAYPHHNRRSRKFKAFAVWKRQGLESRAEAVLGEIRTGKRSHDWKKDGGQYVPAMERWLAGRDFADVEVRDDPDAPIGKEAVLRILRGEAE